jgi:hypothetical protein
MKLKILGVLLLVCLMTTSVFAPNVTWNGTNQNGGGSWSDGTKWSSTPNPPTSPGVYSDEYKLSRQGSLCTIDSAVGPYNGRLRVASGPVPADACASTLNIVTDGSISIAEFRVGDQGMSATNGSVGYVYQTGGTVTMIASSSGTNSYSRNLIIGRCGGSGPAAKGYYRISGGTIAYNNAVGYNDARLIVGGSVNGGASGTPLPTEGTFTVSGNTASITMRKLYVGTDGTYSGTGTVAFEIGDSGVSRIVLDDPCSIVLDVAGTSGTTNLALSALATPPESDIVLIQQAGTDAVRGFFDQLNGVVGAADESDKVVLGGNTYLLTYLYNAEADGGLGERGTGNDIALLIPEPATIALLSLGLLAIRRKK